MFEFSTVGIPVFTLLLSLFHPHIAVAKNVQRREPYFARVMIRPTTPVSPVMMQLNQDATTTTPTETPISATPTPVSTTQPTLTPSRSNDVQTYIMNAINEYRASVGLSAVTTNDSTCGFATTRAQEISSNFSHDGFNQRIQSHTLPYANYALVTENIAETSNYQDVVTMWKNSAPHAENMRADTPYICVESYDNYYAFEGWKPL